MNTPIFPANAQSSLRFVRTPVFFQRVLQVTACLGMVGLLPQLTLAGPVQSLLLLAGMALIITIFLAPARRKQPRWTLAMTIGGSLLAATAVPRAPFPVNTLHLLIYSLLVYTAPLLTWPQAMGSAVVMSAIHLTVKSSWSLPQLLAPTFWPSGVIDVVGKLVLAVAAKNWAELNAAVRDSAVQLSAVMGSSFDLIAIIDRSGTIRSVNGVWPGITGYEPAEIIGRHFMHLEGGEDAQLVTEIAGLLAEGEPMRGVMQRLRRADGSLVWVEWNLTPVPELDAVICAGRPLQRD